MGSFNLALRPKPGASSEPRSTIHRALNAPKVTKNTLKAAKTSQEEKVLMEQVKKVADKAEESAEGVKSCKQLGRETFSIIPSEVQTEDVAMTDVGTNNADLLQKKRSRTLKNYLPKIGMIYNRSGNQLIGDRKTWDLEVLRAIWSQQDKGNKNTVQALIAPVFNQAVLKINHECLDCAEVEDGSFQGGDTPEDNYLYEGPREEDITNMWDTFLRELWYEFPEKSWVRELSKRRFVIFFSLLADARLRERCYPRNDGREHPELVRAITRFLDVAGEAGHPWMLADLEDRLDDYY